MEDQRSAANAARFVGTDAVILLGATCGGPQEYAEVAEELGYGPLQMPDDRDLDSIRNQLLQSSAYRTTATGMAVRACSYS